MGLKPSKKHSIERINNKKGYYKENCKWATPVEQCNNRSTNRIIEICGTSKTMAEWCRVYNANYGRVKNRIRNGWTPERAFDII